jgi:NitT/TauT family transport system substrate-binding protein
MPGKAEGVNRGRKRHCDIQRRTQKPIPVSRDHSEMAGLIPVLASVFVAVLRAAAPPNLHDTKKLFRPACCSRKPNLQQATTETRPMRISRRAAGHGALSLAATSVAPRRAGAAESQELRISSLEGFGFLPLFIALDRKLIEARAAALGLNGLRINHLPLRSAVVSTDALLAGQLDVIAGTVTSLLVLWDKTNGDVRAVSDLGGQVLTLVTRNPNIHSIVDFGPTDRIAVPSVRQGPHSLVIGMALDKALGAGSYGKLDTIQVQSGHADAVTMLLSPTHEVNSHFSTLPYVDIELKSTAPKIHSVLTSSEVFGGPTTIISAYATRHFVEQNPIKAAALAAALDDAQEIIANDRMSAANSYIAVTHERFAPEVLADMLTRKGVLYSGVPTRTMLIAAQMARTGLIRRTPVNWKDFHFPLLHDRAGS